MRHWQSASQGSLTAFTCTLRSLVDYIMGKSCEITICDTHTQRYASPLYIYIYKIYTHTYNHGNPHNPQTVSLLLAHPEVHSSYSSPLSKALKEPRRNITRPAAQLSWKPCSADLRYLRSQMDAATALGHGGMG